MENKTLKLIVVENCGSCPYTHYNEQKNKHFCMYYEHFFNEYAIINHIIDKRCPLKSELKRVDDTTIIKIDEHSY